VLIEKPGGGESALADRGKPTKPNEARERMTNIHPLTILREFSSPLSREPIAIPSLARKHRVVSYRSRIAPQIHAMAVCFYSYQQDVHKRTGSERYPHKRTQNNTVVYDSVDPKRPLMKARLVGTEKRTSPLRMDLDGPWKKLDTQLPASDTTTNQARRAFRH